MASTAPSGSNAPRLLDALAEALGVPESAWWLPPAVVAGGLLAGIIIHTILFAVLVRVAQRTPHAGDERFARAVRRPAALLIPLITALFVLPLAGLEERAHLIAVRGLTIGIILSGTWLANKGLASLVRSLLRHYDMEAENNYRARQVHTQLRVITRMISIVLWVLGLAAVLMIFPAVQRFGTSIIASAGIAGIVVGFAAQKSLGNFIAGLQIALTQPIKIDDVVVIDGEWGRIEDITNTYVVVAIWDQRRLIVPFSRIIDTPFQNWTRTNSEILGTVFIHADYSLPVQAVREELRRICEQSDLWDRRVCGLVVTEAQPHTIQLRALVSAKNSSAAWDLRCLVRERLIDYIRREHPDSLPRTRLLPVGPVAVEGAPA